MILIIYNRDVEAVEYFLLTLPAPYKVSRFRVYFRFQLLSLKCFRFHKNLTTSNISSSSFRFHIPKNTPTFGSSKKVKCFRVRFRFQLLSSKCFRKNLTASASTSLIYTHSFVYEALPSIIFFSLWLMPLVYVDWTACQLLTKNSTLRHRNFFQLRIFGKVAFILIGRPVTRRGPRRVRHPLSILSYVACFFISLLTIKNVHGQPVWL